MFFALPLIPKLILLEDFLSKAPGFIATLFIICSLSLTINSRGDLEPTMSVLDKIEESSDDAPKIPENNN